MNFRILLTAILAFLPVSAGAQEAGMGTIVMFRPSSIMGAALGCPIRWHEKELVELGRGKYAEWKVPAGQYILTNKTSSVPVTVAAGETQYVRCLIKPGFMTGRADLQLTDKETFEQHKADYSQKELAVSVP